MSINLLPREFKKSKRIFFNKPIFFKVVVLYGVFFLLTNGLLWLVVNNLEQKTMTNQLLSDEITEIENTLEILHEQQKMNENQIIVLKNLLEDRSNTYESLKIIQTSLPEDLDLSKIVFNNTNNLFILGKTASLNLLEVFLADLGRYQYFEEIALSELENELSTDSHTFKIKLLINIKSGANHDG